MRQSARFFEREVCAPFQRRHGALVRDEALGCFRRRLRDRRGQRGTLGFDRRVHVAPVLRHGDADEVGQRPGNRDGRSLRGSSRSRGGRGGEHSTSPARGSDVSRSMDRWGDNLSHYRRSRSLLACFRQARSCPARGRAHGRATLARQTRPMPSLDRSETAPMPDSARRPCGSCNNMLDVVGRCSRRGSARYR